MRDSKQRVVITGLGVVAANGIGKEAFWQTISRGTPAITPLRSPHNTSSWVAGAVNDFIAQEYLDRKMVNRSDPPESARMPLL